MIKKLVSGWQTGADIAALDLALRYDFPHGEWRPKRRWSRDGIPAKYREARHQDCERNRIQRIKKSGNLPVGEASAGRCIFFA